MIDFISNLFKKKSGTRPNVSNARMKSWFAFPTFQFNLQKSEHLMELSAATVQTSTKLEGWIKEKM